MSTPERSLVVVRNHVPWRMPDEARNANLSGVVAVVLSTVRRGAVDMVLDHNLWFAAMAAIRDACQATQSEVFLEPTPRLLEWLRRPRPRMSVGSLEHGDVQFCPDVDDVGWDTILWRRRSEVVAAATCERWYLGGGPFPYHDSYTTSVFVDPTRVDALLDSLSRHVRDEGGLIEAVMASPQVV